MARLTVLGGCGAWPEAGRACSGFILERDGFRVVLDLGFGTLPRLLAECPNGAVDAVIVTHEHSDHCVDLNGLFRARYFDPDRNPDPGYRVPLYCTPGVTARVEQLEPTGALTEVFDIRELPTDDEVGPFRLESTVLPHHVLDVGVRLTVDGVTLAYTGDTGPDPALAELGRDADLFIIEATRSGERSNRRPRYHLTAREAGEWLTRAGARRGLLTHFWPGSDRGQILSEAAERYTGELLLADEGLVVELGPH